MKGARFVAMADEKSGIAHITIFEDVDTWYGISGQDVIDQLAGQTWSEVHLWISSYGGSIDEGFKIYDAIAGLSALTVAHLMGTVASIATVIACACDEIEISRQANYMIHQGSVQPYGAYKADELEDLVTQLRQKNNRIVDVYKRKTGLPEDELVVMMSRDFWIEPDDALALGFVDRVVDNLVLPIEDLQPYSSSYDYYDYFWFKAEASAGAARMTAKGYEPIKAEKVKSLTALRSVNSHNKFNDMNFGQKLLNWANGRGFQILDKDQKAVSPEALTKALKEDDGTLIAPEEISALLTDGVNKATEQIKASVMDEIQETLGGLKTGLDNITEKIETLEGDLGGNTSSDDEAGNVEKEEEQDEAITNLQEQIEALNNRLAVMQGKKKTGGADKDRATGLETDTPGEKNIAFGAGSGLAKELNRGGYSTNDWNSLQEAVNAKRKKLGKAV